MNDRLYTPFLEAAESVFRLMLALEDIAERPPEEFNHDQVLNISIGVVGDLKGQVIYSFPSSTSLEMVKIMSGMEFAEMDGFVVSAISEIANIISGNVLTLLSSHDLTCDILPPELYGADCSEAYSHCRKCCMTTPAGEVCIDIRLNAAAG